MINLYSYIQIPLLPKLLETAKHDGNTVGVSIDIYEDCTNGIPSLISLVDTIIYNYFKHPEYCYFLEIPSVGYYKFNGNSYSEKPLDNL